MPSMQMTALIVFNEPGNDPHTVEQEIVRALDRLRVPGLVRITVDEIATELPASQQYHRGDDIDA